MKTFLQAFMAVSFLASAAGAYEQVDFKKQISELSLMSPSGVSASGERIYLSDSKANSVFIFDREGKLLEKTGTRGQGNKNFDNPGALAYGNGKVYIADTGNSRIQVIDADGRFLWVFGSRGSEQGQLDKPEAVAVASDGRVYVADTGNNRVQIYSADGIFLYGFTGKETGKPGISRPSRIAVDPSDSIYVLDSGGSRIVKFTPEGTQTQEIAVRADAFCVDRYGFIYAVEARQGKVREMDKDGKVLGVFGTSGAGPGQFLKPSDMTADPSGSLLVADAGNKRALEFRLENKDKSTELPVNPRTRINLLGPAAVYKQKVAAFTPLKDSAIAGYLPDSRELALISRDGTVKKKFGKRGKELGQTYEPQGLAFSAEKGILVSDTGNNRIQIFTAEGEVAAAFGEKAGMFGSSSKEGRLSDPAGVAVNEKGTLYVADTRNARIQAFNPDGIFLFSIGPKLGSYMLKEPVSVQWDPAGYLYFLDRSVKKIFKVEPSGKLVSAWGRPGPGIQELEDPVAMAYDGRNYIYVLDRKAARLKLYDIYGNWVTNFFAKGKGEKELYDPAGVGFADGKVFISDPGNSKVLAFEVRPILAPPARIAASASEGKARLEWTYPDKALAAKYHVYRSSVAGGPYAETAATDSLSVVDAPEETHTTYYYQIAVEAWTGDVGFKSGEIRIFLPGSVNVAQMALDKIDLGYIFSANYKYYLKNPVGKVVVANNTDDTFSKVTLSFSLKDFMDFPYDNVIEEIGPRKKVEVPLMATLNNRILDVSEDTPIQAQFKVTYYDKGKEQVITLNKPVKVLSRNAIIWDRSERMANFITPKDPPVFAFSRSALLMKPKAEARLLNRNLSTALMLWSAAGELGISYLTDPANPYEKIKTSQEFPLDTVQMPRDTLKLKSGECKDLVGLFATLFEGAGLRTAMIDYPGHISLMFDTGLADPAEIGVPSDRLIKYQDTYWMPVETTMAGKSFAESTRQALNTYKNSEKEARIIDTRKAWQEFEPVTLPEARSEGPMPDKEGSVKRFSEDAKVFSKMRYDYLKEHFEENKDETDSAIGLGILEAQYGNYEAAKARFNKILAKDALNPSALNNMGSVYFEEKNYSKAAELYLKASRADQYDAGIWMNRARASLKMGDSKAAKTLAGKAVELDSGLRDMADALLHAE